MSDELVQSIAQRFEAVQERLAGAAAAAGRPVESVRLVAVTKTFPVPVIAAAYQAGLRHFGENRIEELASKRQELAANAYQDLVWHQIGTLQSRKTTLAADNADVFHALDREKVARRLSRRLQETGRQLPVYAEVNLSGESSKAGYNCHRWESDATQRAELRNAIRLIQDLPGLEFTGLMMMAPYGEAEKVLRELFRRTRQLAEWLETELPDRPQLRLSMGMTDDFELAIQEGATDVRIGRALFGPRR